MTVQFLSYESSDYEGGMCPGCVPEYGELTTKERLGIHCARYISGQYNWPEEAYRDIDLCCELVEKLVTGGEISSRWLSDMESEMCGRAHEDVLRRIYDKVGLRAFFVGRVGAHGWEAYSWHATEERALVDLSDYEKSCSHPEELGVYEFSDPIRRVE